MYFSKVILKSSLSQITELEKFIDSIMLNYNIEEQYRGVISVPLVESVKNAIIHGNKCDIAKKVTVSMQVQNSKLKFSVEDEGEGFDYGTAGKESGIKENKRGLYKIETLAEDVDFEKNGACISYKINVPFRMMVPGRENLLRNVNADILAEQYI
ncbi:MAG: ATP-binding protein [Bacteroidales bacterium]|nr:ATP-binding protein [Bacteroidales bacterium]